MLVTDSKAYITPCCVPKVGLPIIVWKDEMEDVWNNYKSEEPLFSSCILLLSPSTFQLLRGKAAGRSILHLP